MTSLQDSPHPLVYRVTSLPPEWHAPLASTGEHTFRSTVRALEGMQKEAVVHGSSRGSAWRLVCDEGPYLNGTDLAPFPLGFFCAGMAASFMAELLPLVREHDIPFSKLKLLQDNRYAMEGSALKGTMTGSALPVELQLVTDSPADPQSLQKILRSAIERSPASALLGELLNSHFTLIHNNKRLEPVRVRASAEIPPPRPAGFDALKPEHATPMPDAIISKLRSAEVIQGVSGGSGSSLSASQKRVLHMQGECRVREDGLFQIDVNLFQPLGSQFRFLADPAGERAPDGLVYLNAGLAFCFMTQIGRYMTIRKQPLDDYCIVQDTHFSFSKQDARPRMQPVVTHVYLESGHDDAYATDVVAMSEQTCFLHAACRQSIPLQCHELGYAIPIIP